MMEGRCDCKDMGWSSNSIGAKCPYCGAVIHIEELKKK